MAVCNRRSLLSAAPQQPRPREDAERRGDHAGHLPAENDRCADVLGAIRNSSDDANGDRGYADPMDPVKRKRRQQQQQNHRTAKRRNKSADAEERDRQMGTPANRQRVRVVDA